MSTLVLKPPSNLSTRLSTLLVDEKYTDCSFDIENNIVRCHKLILCSASPVFEAMFYGPMAEKNCIEIPDISYETFKLMLNFVYTDNLQVFNTTKSTNKPEDDDENIDNLLELYLCAEKYLINDLIVQILKLIHQKLRFSNILKILDFSICCNLKSLKLLCTNFFNKCCLNNYNFSLILANYNYHITKTCLNFITNEYLSENRDDKNHKNLNIILLIKKWLINEYELSYIDFNNLKYLLNDVEINDDITHDLIKLNTLNFHDFSLSNNKFSWITCQRTYYKAVKPFVIKRNEMEFITDLTCDRFIVLRSISINSKMIPILSYVSNAEKYTENLNIQIITGDNQTIYDQNSIIIDVEYNSILNIVFDRMIILSPDILYKIRIVWNDNAIGGEYPRNIFSMSEERNLCKFNFDKNVDFLSQDGSIVNGLKYAILN